MQKSYCVNTVICVDCDYTQTIDTYTQCNQLAYLLIRYQFSLFSLPKQDVTTLLHLHISIILKFMGLVT